MKFANAAFRSWLGLVVRVVLGAIWIWASLSKISDPRTFVQAVRAYDATPEWLSKAIGYGLPMLELTLGVLLVIGLITRYAAAVSALLFVVFTVGILQAAARDIKLHCGCFGGGGAASSTTYTLDVLRDLGLLVLAVYLIVWHLTKFSVDEALIKSEQVVGLTPKQAKSEKNVRRYNAARAAAEVELRHKQRYVALGTGVVVVLVSLIAIGVQGGRAKITGATTSTNASATTGVTVGNPKAPVTVDLYEDPQCPICNNLEQSGLTNDFDTKITATNIKVNYHVMSFLDSSSNGNKYSSRAANALYCASDESVTAFQKLHNIMYGKDSSGANNQPAEGTNGRTDSQLIAWGKQAGITSATFSTCVSGDQHSALVTAVNDEASKKGVSGTPTVFVAGKRIGAVNSVPTVAQIDAAITKALAGSKSTAAPSTSPAATSSASVTGSVSAPASRSASASGSAKASASATK